MKVIVRLYLKKWSQAYEISRVLEHESFPLAGFLTLGGRSNDGVAEPCVCELEDSWLASCPFEMSRGPDRDLFV
ncbi:hypothetical protein CHH75_21590 [Paenibacillus sp. 7541]|uniref:Uncharacterized protein n=1 Tax=Paenibacillus campinasensis TaxID=66347 RepID=A0A268EG82_9BACL|nr:hypothetical protein CHH67_23220 [Paenibacillus campinasensis]PAK49060.1 hypothetical protein CHH75_21590 [Paenibacillus sp. 7541]